MPIPKNKRIEQDWIKKNLAQLLNECPYFFGRDQIPPLPVLNARLMSREWQPSMNPGVNWEPFEIEEDRFSRLVQELMESDARLKEIECPDWVQTEDDWAVFLAEQLDGIPAPEHRDKRGRVREAEAARDDVMFNGKPGDLSALSTAAIFANIELDEFIKSYRKKEA